MTNYNIKCMVGLHDWEFTKAHYKHPGLVRLACEDKKATRTCKRCGKFQTLTTHLLGLNPPAYDNYWNTEKKNGKII